MKIPALAFVLLSLSALFETGCSELSTQGTEGSMIKMRGGVLGGVRNFYRGPNNNADEIESIGRFAVQEHNKEKNSFLKFGRVIEAREQVVAGKMYHLTLDLIDAGKNKIYEARVWVKPWMNFRQLQEFKHADVSSVNLHGLGATPGH